MTLKFHWFLPTSGDGRAIMGRGHSLPLGSSGSALGADSSGNGSQVTGAAAVSRPPDIAYLAQVARSAEQLGFKAVLTPTGTWCEDAWLVTAALISQTERLRFLVAFRPGLVSPTLAAQMAATYQRVSGGRLLLNVVTGGQAEEQARFGDHLSHDQRYARASEFLAIVRGAWSGQPFDFAGEHYQVKGATVMRPPDPPPGIYFGGSSAAAGPVAAGRAGPRRRGHRAGRQPPAGRRPDRGVRGPWHRRVHPVRLPAPGGGLLVRRGRAARAAQTRRPGRAGRPYPRARDDLTG